MFDTKILVSPLNDVIDTIRRQNNDTYDLLLTKNNAEVVTVDTLTGEYNTTAVINNLNDVGEITKLGREVVYNRVDLGLFIRENTQLVVGRNNVATHHLLSYRDLGTILNPTGPHVAQVLRAHYDLPVEAIDVEVTTPYDDGSQFNPDEGSNNPGDYPRIVNGTIENTLYTYTGGFVPVGHLNDCPLVDTRVDTGMVLGLQVVRKLAPKEVLELTLPLIKYDDDWTVMFESLYTESVGTQGNLWFKLKLDTATNSWVLYMQGRNAIWLSGQRLVTIQVTKESNVLTVKGIDVNGNVSMVKHVGDAMLSSDELQRITTYTNNPFPRILQFKLKSSNDNNIITVADTAAADKRSNALFSSAGSPIIITDAVCLNYVESDLDRFVSRYDNVLRGSVTKLTQINTDTEATLITAIANFSKLCLDGIFKRLTLKITNINDVDNAVTVEYNIVGTDVIAKTIQVVVSLNGEPAPVKTVKLYDLAGVFKVKICPGHILVASSDDTLVHHPQVLDDIGPFQYQVEFGIEQNTAGKLPSITFDKSVVPCSLI